jgi:hypothetical protein
LRGVRTRPLHTQQLDDARLERQRLGAWRHSRTRQTVRLPTGRLATRPSASMSRSVFSARS